eukprot:m.31108 g.31108  ORF g.31108 m.31108 type:complete len:52 (+) comp6896_c0_seq1:169-324(+)
MQQHVGYDMPLTDAQAAVIPLSEVSQQYARPQQCEEHFLREWLIPTQTIRN